MLEEYWDSGEHSRLIRLCWTSLETSILSKKHSLYYPGQDNAENPRGVAGLIECPTEQLSASRANFRELPNDPATLLTGVRCENCDIKVQAGEAAFAVQDYAGKYIGYVCPLCHPNRKWINGLWRSALGDVFSQNGSQTGSLLASIISRTVH